jgi:tetratricopeptide (TPR) repeat protein
LHARIAQALEMHFSEIIETRPDLLAYHYAQAEPKRQAIEYVERAIQRAFSRMAHGEAIGHARQALEWLDAYDEPRERARAEFRLNHLLLVALKGHRGYLSPEADAASERSRALIEILGDEREIMPALWSLILFYLHQARLSTASELEERALSLARKFQDTDQEAAILPLLALMSFNRGRFVEARELAEQGLALYRPERQTALGALHGLDCKAIAHYALALEFCVLGYPKQALQHGLASKLLESQHELCDRFGLVMFKNECSAWSAYVCDDAEEMKRLVQAPLGLEIMRPYMNIYLAELEARRGHYEEALARLADMQRRFTKTGRAHPAMAEVYCLQGRCLFEQGRGQEEAAEAALHTAITLAQQQSARLFELRACVTLARLRLQQGRQAEAQALVQPVYDWFTEGWFHFPDLIEARQLLGLADELPTEQDMPGKLEESVG